ncbi:MAG TPA: LamG-like jellyroll fold domain-containing protein, partial [Jatrophihabitantaceae bacterium]|nr:LamG-like jellyroll fold domain-containing protein [Jatrophihabitantaceae bacterium]
GVGGTGPLGLNHPVSGTTAVTSNVWHHAAATYDGTTWRLYLDGALDKTLVVGAFTPEATSIQHAALGTAMTSSGVAAGFFAGVLDESRIWSLARSGAQIAATRDAELTTAQAGLLGRWGMTEGAGTVVANSAGTAGVNGTATNGPVWVAGFVPPAPNNLPGVSLNGPADGASGQASSVSLEVTATDADGGTLSVTFYGRAWASGVFVQLGGTSVPAGSSASQSWSALGAGDIAICPDASTNTGLITSPILDGVAGTIFTAGDDAYTNGTAAEFADCYDPSWGGAATGHDLKARTAIPVPGNHEYGTPGATGYFNYFGAVAGDPARGYYGYDVPASNWRVITLNSECAQVGGCIAGSVQETWYESELAASAAKNVIVIWHKPRWSSGSTNLVELQAFWADAYAAGVDLVLVGHDHVYERFMPMDAAGASDPVAGVTQITIGTGGEGHHTFGTPKATSLVRNATTFGVLKLTLHAASFEWAFLPEPGQTFSDAGSQAVHDAPNQAPLVSSVVIDQASPTTNQTLSATVVASDPDNDPLTLSYQWSKNGTDIAAATAATLDLSVLGNGNRGDAIRVRVTASDGLATSAPVTSSPVSVVNSAPSVTSVSISPTGPTTNQTLTASASASDPDGDTTSLSYQWTKNGTDIAGATGTTLDLSIAGNGNAGDSIGLRASASDGTTSASATATPTTVVNSPPAVSSVTIDQASPTTNQTLSATVVASDPDGGTPTIS